MSIKFAVINATASGVNTVVAAVSGKKLRVLGYSASATAAVTSTWKSASTAISGPMALGVAGNVSVGLGAASFMSEFGVFETAVGEALVLNLSLATTVGGHLVYREVQV